MENKNRKIMTCNQTRAVRSDMVVPQHLNDKHTVYGGEIMSHFDTAAGFAVYNFLQRPAFTATMDQMNFLEPIHEGELVYIESYVSGAGKTSVEAFAKLISIDVRTAEKKLCAYAFLTYVLQDRSDPTFQMPQLQPETEEEKTVCSGYEERRQWALKKREADQKMKSQIGLQPIWETIRSV